MITAKHFVETLAYTLADNNSSSLVVLHKQNHYHSKIHKNRDRLHKTLLYKTAQQIPSLQGDSEIKPSTSSTTLIITISNNKLTILTD